MLKSEMVGTRHTYFHFGRWKDVATIQCLYDLYGFYRVRLYWGRKEFLDFKTYEEALEFVKNNFHHTDVIWC